MTGSSDVEQAVPASSGAIDTAEQLGRARELVAQGRWAEALPLCEAVARSAPNLPGIFLVLAETQAKLEMWERAARSYLHAIQRDPQNPTLFQKMGDLQRLCGDLDGAATSYGHAAGLTSSQREGRRYLAFTGGAAAATSYLELMKGCLTFLLWEASDGPSLELDVRRPLMSIKHIAKRITLRRRPAPTTVRELGMDWPAHALTMIGKKRLDNIQECTERVLEDRVPGDLLEAGVWRGGATIFMRAVLRAYGDTDRKVWVADSFRGLPPPDADTYPADRDYDLSMWKSLAVSADEVRDNFRRFDLLDDQVEFLEGWFADTLPNAPIEKLAVLRLDGDLYESTMDGLVHLYPKVSPGGFVIADDYYGAPPCQKAVDDFRRQHAIGGEMVRIDWSGAYWRKQ